MQSPQRVIVTGVDQPIGSAAAAGLSAAGQTVVGLHLASPDRSDASRHIGHAIDELRGLDLLVLSGWHAPALAPITFEDLDDATFGATWEGGMLGMLWALQPAIPHLRTSGGSVIVIVPTTGMTGGANYAAAAATFEGQRILMKAAARQLAPEGIRVNAIAVGAELVLTDSEAADVHYLAPGSGSVQAPNDVVDVITFIASAAGRQLNGQTITIDGGRWLAP